MKEKERKERKGKERKEKKGEVGKGTDRIERFIGKEADNMEEETRAFSLLPSKKFL